MTQFDDRYDPIYQRGHGIPADAGPQDLSAERAGGTTGSPGKAANDGAQAGFLAAPAAARPASGDQAGPAGISEVVPPELAGREEEHDAAVPPRPKFNPFLLALWLLGAGAIALGLWGALGPITAMDDPFGTSSGFGSPQWMYLFAALSPGLVAGGLMALATALALHSLAWQRRRA
jgi:hypothetical protein